MQSVGQQLQRARLEKGLDLQAVGVRTKIHVRYLEAIEADDRQSLPSSFFYRSFVHQYATLLGLETAALDSQVEQILSADAPLPLPGHEPVSAKMVAPVLPDSGPRWSKAVIASFGALVVMIATGAGVYAWWHTQQLNEVAQAAVPQVAPSSPAASPAPAASSPAEEQKAAPKSTEAENTERTNPTPAESAAPKSTSPSDQAVSASQPSQPKEAAPGYKVMLDLIAHEATWLSASSDGQPVFSGVLAANETKTIEGKQSAKLRIGNAAGLEFRLNGKLIRPLGARGQVLTVLFTPGDFQILMPTKEGDD